MDIKDFVCGVESIEDVADELARTVFDPGGHSSNIAQPFTAEELHEFEMKATAVLNEATAVGEFFDDDLDMSRVQADS